MLRGVVIGGEEVAARFDQMPPALQVELRTGITRAVLRIQKHVKADKLSGQVLNVRTGRLRRSVTFRVEQEPGKTTGIVGTNVSYARAHEYGFHGPVTVREHLRKVKSGTVATVRAHSRQMNLPARSFLRSALADLVPETRSEIEQALARAKATVFAQ